MSSRTRFALLAGVGVCAIPAFAEAVQWHSLFDNDPGIIRLRQLLKQSAAQLVSWLSRTGRRKGALPRYRLRPWVLSTQIVVKRLFRHL